MFPVWLCQLLHLFINPVRPPLRHFSAFIVVDASLSHCNSLLLVCRQVVMNRYLRMKTELVQM
ncbi:hypothetical protein FC549_18195 [Escherichia coli]|nr:hypothetical protein [Escherichia coli]